MKGGEKEEFLGLSAGREYFESRDFEDADLPEENFLEPEIFEDGQELFDDSDGDGLGTGETHVYFQKRLARQLGEPIEESRKKPEKQDPFAQYLKEFSQIELLDREGEQEIGERREQHWQKIFEVLIHPYFLSPILSSIFQAIKSWPEASFFEDGRKEFFGILSETKKGLKKKALVYQWLEELAETIKEEASEIAMATNEFIVANLRLVVFIAKKHLNCGMNFNDLIQEGNLGLIKAAERFDCRRGYRFSTFASWWIRQRIARAINNQMATIRIPVHMREKINKMIREARLLAANMEFEPKLEDIAESLGLAIEEVEKVLGLPGGGLSLDDPVGEGGDFLRDFIADEKIPTPEKAIEDLELADRTSKALVTLLPLEESVLRKRFGIGESKDFTLEEIGRDKNFTREYIRQIEAKALQKMQHPRRKDPLKAAYGPLTDKDVFEDQKRAVQIVGKRKAVFVVREPENEIINPVKSQENGSRVFGQVSEPAEESFGGDFKSLAQAMLESAFDEGWQEIKSGFSAEELAKILSFFKKRDLALLYLRYVKKWSWVAISYEIHKGSVDATGRLFKRILKKTNRACIAEKEAGGKKKKKFFLEKWPQLLPNPPLVSNLFCLSRYESLEFQGIKKRFPQWFKAVCQKTKVAGKRTAGKRRRRQKKYPLLLGSKLWLKEASSANLNDELSLLLMLNNLSLERLRKELDFSVAALLETKEQLIPLFGNTGLRRYSLTEKEKRALFYLFGKIYIPYAAVTDFLGVAGGTLGSQKKNALWKLSEFLRKQAELGKEGFETFLAEKESKDVVGAKKREEEQRKQWLRLVFSTDLQNKEAVRSLLEKASFERIKTAIGLPGEVLGSAEEMVPLFYRSAKHSFLSDFQVRAFLSAVGPKNVTASRVAEFMEGQTTKGSVWASSNYAKNKIRWVAKLMADRKAGLEEAINHLPQSEEEEKAAKYLKKYQKKYPNLLKGKF